MQHFSQWMAEMYAHPINNITVVPSDSSNGLWLVLLGSGIALVGTYLAGHMQAKGQKEQHDREWRQSVGRRHLAELNTALRHIDRVILKVEEMSAMITSAGEHELWQKSYTQMQRSREIITRFVKQRLPSRVERLVTFAESHDRFLNLLSEHVMKRRPLPHAQVEIVFHEILQSSHSLHASLFKEFKQFDTSSEYCLPEPTEDENERYRRKIAEMHNRLTNPTST